MPNPELPDNTDFCDLTDREWGVLIELTHDLPNAELADRLRLTTKSLENYKTRMLQAGNAGPRCAEPLCPAVCR